MIAAHHQDPSTAAVNDNLCVAMLGMAETFRLSNPPKVRLAIKCLQAMFHLPMTPQMATVAHFHLGKLLHHYTKNTDLAKTNLERAYNYAQTMQGFEEIRVQVASCLAEIYLQMKQVDLSKNILKQELDMSRSFSFWHCRLLFQMADVCAQTQDTHNACALLEAGAEFCATTNVAYTEALFRLCKGVLIVLDPQRRDELREILERVQSLISVVPGSQSRREELKSFFLVLQVCYFLSTGAVKSAKPCLKQLQTTVQQLTACQEDPSTMQTMSVELFRWLPKEHITILVYLVTVAHSLQSGQMDRVQKYTERALAQIDKLRQYCRFSPISFGSVAANEELLNSLQVLLLENSSMGRLVIGQPSLAIKQINSMIQLVSQSPALFANHEAQSHALLGLYAMSVKCTDAAEKQFNTALRTAKDMDLWTFVNLNLAMVYLQAGRDQDFYGLLERVTPERLQSNSQTLLAAAHYVRGLQSFLQSRNQEAKRYLKDSLAISNKEDVMRVSAAALVLLGHIFLRSSVQECSSMLSPALELANKMPDVPLQAWATSLLKDVYMCCGDTNKANESNHVSETYSHRLDLDRRKAIESSGHRLLEWTEGKAPRIAQ